MAGDEHSMDVCDVWQSQRGTPMRLSPAEIRSKVRTLESVDRRKYISVAIVNIVVLPGLTSWWSRFPNVLVRLGIVLTFLGASFAAVQAIVMWRRLRLAETSAAPSVAFYRAALERQRDVHRGIMLWSRWGIVLPGPLLLVFGLAQHTGKLTMLITVAVAFCLVWLFGISLHRTRALEYQRRIDELDHLQ